MKDYKLFSITIFMDFKVGPIFSLLLALLIFSSGCAQNATVNVNISVIDEHGNPVEDAAISAYSNYSLENGINDKWTNLKGTIEATGTTEKDGKTTLQLLSGNYVFIAKLGGAIGGEEKLIIKGNNLVSITIKKPQAPIVGGLIVVKKNSEIEPYASQLAQNKGWLILETDKKNAPEIRSQIKAVFQQNNFEFLLIIGTDNEIPMHSKIPGHWDEASITDPQLYGDLDQDGFVDLSIGRLPFSQTTDLEKYYKNTEVSGNGIFFEYYNFNWNGNDPVDSFSARQYEYANCLNTYVPDAKSSRFTNVEELVSRYRSGELVFAAAHGSPDAYQLLGVGDGGTSMSIPYICTNCKAIDKECRCNDNEYLSNRPVVLNVSCSNAQEFGIDFVRNGAKAFIGHYNNSGYESPAFTIELLSGETFGSVVKTQVNKLVTRNLAANKEGLNIINLSTLQKYPFEDYGLMLYGDPSFRMNKHAILEPTVKIEERPNEITINIQPPKIINLTEKDKLLCYTGKEVSSESIINTDYWNNTYWNQSHDLLLTFPVKSDIKKLKRATAKIEEKEIELGKDGEFRFNLVKGNTVSNFYILFNSPYTKYDKPLQIKIEFE